MMLTLLALGSDLVDGASEMLATIRVVSCCHWCAGLQDLQ
jgi:hypothetical protein